MNKKFAIEENNNEGNFKPVQQFDQMGILLLKQSSQ